MSQSLVSIVIPFFNHGYFIREAINSVLNQTYQNFEVIIINDGSTDDNSIKELGLIESLDSRILVFNQENQGPCTAKNNGVEKANGLIIGFLDSDNTFLPTYIEKAVSFIEGQDFEWFFGDGLYFGDKTGLKNQSLKGNAEIFINSPIDNCLFIKKEVFVEIGGFDVFLNRLGLEDWELTVNLISNDKQFKYLAIPLFNYRVSQDSRSAKEAHEFKSKIQDYVYAKHSKSLIKNVSDLIFENIKLNNSLEFRFGRILRSFLNKS